MITHKQLFLEDIFTDCQNNLRYGLPTMKFVCPKMKWEYNKESCVLDKYFSKADQGRYSDTCKMFARAFNCYVADKLAAEKSRSQYLTAYLEAYVFMEYGGESN